MAIEVNKTNAIKDIELKVNASSNLSQAAMNERRVAVADLLQSNYFEVNGMGGPYKLAVDVLDNRMVLEVSAMSGDSGNDDIAMQAENSKDSDIDTQKQDIINISVAMSPFRRIIKDYFLVCESYDNAVKFADPAKVESLDMGRRSIHNEGSELISDILSDKVKLNFETARRIFTIICALHSK